MKDWLVATTHQNWYTAGLSCWISLFGDMAKFRPREITPCFLWLNILCTINLGLRGQMFPNFVRWKVFTVFSMSTSSEQIFHSSGRNTPKPSNGLIRCVPDSFNHNSRNPKLHFNNFQNGRKFERSEYTLFHKRTFANIRPQSMYWDDRWMIVKLYPQWDALTIELPRLRSWGWHMCDLSRSGGGGPKGAVAPAGT